MFFNFPGFPNQYFSQGSPNHPDENEHMEEEDAEYEDMEEEEQGNHHEHLDPNKDLYEVLGLTSKTTEAEIKKAYKKLAKTLHPDKGGDPEKFKELNEAFEILSDPERREVYDKFGLAGLHEHDMAEGEEDFGGIFNPFMANNLNGKVSKKAQKLKPMLKELSITLEDVYQGSKIKFQHKRYKICEKCEGKGGVNAQSCPGCKGKGLLEKMMMLGPGMYQHMTVPCTDCKGEGRIVEEKDLCEECKGKRVIEAEKELEVTLDPGVPNEHDYLFEGEGHEEPEYLAGDLYVRANIQAHSLFKRIGADLFIDKEISLVEALIGTEFEIELLNKEKIIISTHDKEVINPNETKMVKGKGMPFFKDPEHFGNLYIHFRVVFPKSGEIPNENLKILSKILPSLEGEELVIKDEKTLIMEEFDEKEINTNPEGGKASEEEQEFDDMTHGGGQKIQCGTQ